MDWGNLWYHFKDEMNKRDKVFWVATLTFSAILFTANHHILLVNFGSILESLYFGCKRYRYVITIDRLGIYGS